MNEPVETWAWLGTDDGARAIERAAGETTPAAVAALRKSYGTGRSRVAVEAARARAKATKKLDPGFAGRLVADVAGVEMASSALSSTHKARRLREALGSDQLVADLCCGVGADTWGLLSQGLHTIGVDLNPARAWMCAHNTGANTVCGDAVMECPTAARAFHLDPARRTEKGRRSLRADDFEPGPDAWRRLIDLLGDGVIKLNPGIDASILPEGELEIISEPAGLTQAVLWTGALAGRHERRATRLSAHGRACSIAGQPERPDGAHEIGAHIGTLDPCVERADLVGVLLDTLAVRLVHPGTGLVTANEPAEHPMVRWYRVVEVMAWNRKRVRAALKGLGSGLVEVRTRGGVVNPDEEQRQLRGKGERTDLAVLVYRLGERVVAVIAEQMSSGDEKNPVRLGDARGDGEL